MTRPTSAPKDYAVAALAVVLGLLARLPVWSVLGNAVPFLTFFPAVMFAAWRYGLKVGVFATVLSTLAATYVLIEPQESLRIQHAGDFVALMLFACVGTFMSWAVEEMHQARREEKRLRVLSQLTLAGIGDGVISADAQDRIAFLNPAAERITGWTGREATGQPVNSVFRITGEDTDPELARRDGSRIPVEHSRTSVHDGEGNAAGSVILFRDISRRRQAERSAAATQEHLRRTLHSITDGFVSLDADWNFTFINPAAEQILGRSQEQLIGKNYWVEFAAATGAEAEELYRVAVAEQRSVRFENFWEPLAAWFEVNACPSGDNGLAILFRDITASKRTEARDAFLIRLDDALRPLMSADEITQTTARLLGELLKVNRCAYAVVEPDGNSFGLTGDFNDGVDSIVGQYTLAQFGAECLRLMRDGRPWVVEDTETDRRTADVRDSYRTTHIRSVICVPLQKAGRFAAGMAVHQATPRRWRPDEVELVQQVASRCWESIERARFARELQEREQRFRFLAESIPQMVWTTTQGGQLDYVNKRAADYFGASGNLLLGTGWLEFIHPEDRSATLAQWHRSLETGEPYETGFRLRRGIDGSWRWHLARALAMRGPGGGVQQWIGTCTDIEDQKTAELALKLANQGLEEFAFVASHDLQEPMRMVHSYTELLLRRIGERTDPELCQFSEYIRSGVMRMEKLIKDMLTYSQTLHGPGQAVQTTANLDRSLQLAMSLVEARIAETGGAIDYENLPVVLGDEAQLEHVFQNLLSNALKYSDPRRPPRIQIGSCQQDGMCVVWVRDNGIGFDQRYAEQVFGLFKRLHGRDEYSGTGLGLAICKRIIERYGGRMWAESVPGAGSTFYFSLPAVA